MAFRKSLALAAVCAIGIAGAAFAAGCGDDTALAPADAGLDTAVFDAGPGDAVVPKGARVLGAALAVGDESFAGNVDLLRRAGARTLNVTVAWDEVERPFDAGTDDGSTSDDAGDAATNTALFAPSLHIANLLLSDDGLSAVVAAPALDVGGSRAPAELTTQPLDDPALAARYDKLTDYVLASFPDTPITAFLLGTSVDVALGADTAKHAAFATFVTHAAHHVHAAHPNVKVGFTVTAAGITASAPLRAALSAAWAASDVIGVTILPAAANGQVGTLADLATTFDGLVAAVPAEKPILVHEVGSPTAGACGGSQANQAAFVGAVFAAWDRHADRVPVLVFRELADATADVVDALAARYGRSDAAFVAFLASLGLRTANGQDKQGFVAFQREAHARAF